MTSQFMTGSSYLYAQQKLIVRANQHHTFSRMTELCKQSNEIAKSIVF